MDKAKLEQAWNEIHGTFLDDMLNLAQKKQFVISILQGQLNYPPAQPQGEAGARELLRRAYNLIVGGILTEEGGDPEAGLCWIKDVDVFISRPVAARVPPEATPSKPDDPLHEVNFFEWWEKEGDHMAQMEYEKDNVTADEHKEIARQAWLASIPNNKLLDAAKALLKKAGKVTKSFDDFMQTSVPYNDELRAVEIDVSYMREAVRQLEAIEALEKGEG